MTSANPKTSGSSIKEQKLRSAVSVAPEVSNGVAGTHDWQHKADVDGGVFSVFQHEPNAIETTHIGNFVRIGHDGRRALWRGSNEQIPSDATSRIRYVRAHQ